MTLLPCPAPAPPGWPLDWRDLNERFEWIRSMQGCPQDPIHHAEGDVWIHTRMVGEALTALDEWRALGEADRETLFAAALLHDVAKPRCTRVEDGRITSRGHSQRGSRDARRILWAHGADLVRRESVCAMVRFHQLPFFLIDRPDARRMSLLISQQTNCGQLALLATADALGRQCDDHGEILTKIALFREFCAEQGCLNQPWEFPSPLSRFEYFRREDRDPLYRAHDEARCEVIVMSGLPGSGKDTWLREHAPEVPMISLDNIRAETGARRSGDQGKVAQTARERAREFLRAGTAFAWNATNITRELRSELVDLVAGYGGRSRLVYVEAPWDALGERNSRREKPAPEAAIERMLDRWEVPDATEAPVVEWWENADGFVRRR
ncbi:MAG: AAA family ATPase [Bryobacteraceae bacterium]